MGRGLAIKTTNLIAASREILREMQPATVRGVCYKLFNLKLIPGMDKNSTGRVSRVLTTAREHGLIPWAWIVDETRPITRIAGWENPDAFIESTINDYRKDRWTDQPERVIVISEKGTVGGILRPVLYQFGVDFAVYHGFGSASAIKNLADYSDADTRPLTLIYVGDHDPSGRYMSDCDIPDRLSEYGGRATVERVAVDLDQIADPAMAFPAADKKNDARYRWFLRTHGDTCCELDAMDANDLRSTVRQAIVEHIDLLAWNRAAQVERVERESLTNFLQSWPGAA